ncbi:hypothetical protein ACODM8_00420 [Vibrio ostreicida]|uniref:hypothetical protein n=1 Tax=Vibrio ostreicida TaxID=526588 RepID=UPI003B5A9A4E
MFENTMNVTNNRTLEDEEKNSRKPKEGITLPKGRDEQRQYQTGYLSPLILGGWSILFINNSKKNCQFDSAGMLTEPAHEPRQVSAKFYQVLLKKLRRGSTNNINNLRPSEGREFLFKKLKSDIRPLIPDFKTVRQKLFDLY